MVWEYHNEYEKLPDAKKGKLDLKFQLIHLRFEDYRRSLEDGLQKNN